MHESERIRVFLLVTSSAGGAGVQAYQIARDLDPGEFEVTVALGPGYPLDEDFDRLETAVEYLSLSRNLSPFTNLRGLFQVWRRLRRRRYDVLVTSCSLAGFVGRLAAAFVPAARAPLTVHILQVYASRPYQFALRRIFFRWVERRLDRLTTRYVAVSRAGKRYGVETGIMAPEKVEVIFNAAELPDPRPGARAAVRTALGFDAHAPVVGTLGRYEEQKGLEYFLHAAARAAAVRDDVRFCIVGDGPLRGELEALACRLGIGEAVRFTGWRKDVPEVLAALDIFCLASLWESFGIVLAESMLAGLPVVATRVDGIPEVVEEGETGLLVPPQDAETLAQRLVSLVEDPERRRSMGCAGRARAEELFSVNRMVRSYACFLRDLVQARSC